MRLVLSLVAAVLTAACPGPCRWCCVAFAVEPAPTAARGCCHAKPAPESPKPPAPKPCPCEHRLLVAVPAVPDAGPAGFDVLGTPDAPAFGGRPAATPCALLKVLAAADRGTADFPSFVRIRVHHAMRC